MATDKQRPIFEQKAWPLSVVVFEFENDDGVNHSIRVVRSFKRNEEGAEWETTEWMDGPSLLPAAQLLTAAWTFLQDRQQARYERRREGRQTART